MVDVTTLILHRGEERRRLVVEDSLLARSLADILRRHHLPLNTRCGQRGLCANCVIHLLGGPLIHIDSGRAISAADQPVLLRGCEHRLSPGSTVEIDLPPASLLTDEPRVVSNFRINVGRAHDPLWQRLKARRERSPLDAVRQAAAEMAAKGKHCVIDADAAVAVPNGFDPPIALEYQGDTWRISTAPAAPRRPVGVAVDIGTTTVVVLLVDLDSGAVLAEAAGFNRQIHSGDDVLTRIQMCMADPANVTKLRDEVIGQTIEPLMLQAMKAAGVDGDRIVCMSLAGNTTMLHLWAGVDPSSIGVAPFTPAFLEHRVIRGLPMGGTAHLLPGVAGYIGADIVAGLLVSGMAYDQATCLLVDIGTNGEIVLRHQGKMIGCSTAAGPAFEGSRLKCGMRAGAGAIAHLRMQDAAAPGVEVIGSGKPIGFCGTAYVDFLAQARRSGLLGPMGRFTRSPNQRLVTTERTGLAYVVAHGLGKQPLMITETDVAGLMQAKAAIGAGIGCLLKSAGLRPADVDKVHLAGGFGLNLDIGNAIACGLLPGFEPGQIVAIGNSSLAGAYLALLDSGALTEMRKISRQVEILELNLDPSFEACYIDQLLLP